MIGAQRLEQRATPNIAAEHDQDVAMAERDRFRPASMTRHTFDGDENLRDRKRRDAEHERKEAGPGQFEVAEIEQRGLPDEQQA